MKRPLLFLYQLLIGASDASTGVLLVVAPSWTLHLMHLLVPEDALPFLSWIGAFVFAVGICCLYGAFLAYSNGCASQLTLVWLLTAILRSSVAIYIVYSVLRGTLEVGWVTVGLFDGACSVLQATGLRRGWLVHEEK